MRASSALSVLLLALAGCSSYGPGDLRAGQTEADAGARLGKPTTRATLPTGGTRLDYALGPFGKHTYRVELDSAGRMASVSQLLTDSNFETVRAGWSKQQVVDQLGPASETRGGWGGLGTVWSYRYDWRAQCRWFQVWLVEDRVHEAAYAADPLCDDRCGGAGR